ncbi:MAG TPA: sodium:calcium antiporter [Candidatus Bathyarchaeia archaeon]|nr:sodium:calcium antiporter [Candidatus Bathyarchaeia archaeon]
MIPLVSFLLIAVFSLLLIKATDILIVNLKKLADATRLGEFAVTSFILALATSLPELFVGISAAIEGSPNLSLGNVIGSNIADLSLVIGGAAIVGGSLSVQGIFLTRDVFYAFLAGAAPMLLLFDKNLSRIDGLILLALYGFYNVSVLSQRVGRIAEERGREESILRKIIRRLNYGPSTWQLQELGWIFFGAALLLFSSDMIVRSAIDLASGLNLPLLLIGLFLVSAGTSLPELVFEIKAVKERKPSMVFGDLLGSIVANGTLVIGITSLISPFQIRAFADYLLATMVYVMIFALFYLFIRTKKKLERWEGFVLCLVFVFFLILEVIR